MERDEIEKLRLSEPEGWTANDKPYKFKVLGLPPHLKAGIDRSGFGTYKYWIDYAGAKYEEPH